MLFRSLSATEISIAAFSTGALEPWSEKSFAGQTRYELVDTPVGKVMRATSKGTASGLFREIRIDLKKTPYLHWSWRVENIYQDIDERIKSGDDYPARLYVVLSGGLFFWKTRAVNYVWSSKERVGSHWPNAFTRNARMVAVRSGSRDTGEWVKESRNVRQDLRDLFGEELTEIDAVAIMTDSDNSGQSATAYYGDIYFSDKP